MEKASVQIQDRLMTVERDLGLKVTDRAKPDHNTEKVIVGVFWIVQMQEQAENTVEASRFGFTTDFNLLKLACEKYPKLDVQGYDVVAPRCPKTYNAHDNSQSGESLSQIYGYWYENGSTNNKDIVIGASGHFLKFLGVLTDPFFKPERPYKSLETLHDSTGLGIKKYKHSFFDWIDGRKQIGSNFWIVKTDNNDGSTLSYDVSTSVGHATALRERETPKYEVISYQLPKDEWKIAWFRTFYVIGERMVGAFAYNPANMMGNTSRLANILWKEAWDMAKEGKRVDDDRAITPMEVSVARDIEQIYDPGAKGSGQDDLVVHACRQIWRAADISVFFDAVEVD